MKFVTLALCFASFAASAQMQNHINFNTNAIADVAKDVVSKFNFNYYVKYLGPSLSNDMQSGSTYNRFSTGQDWKDDEQDFVDSHQVFQAFKLGYKLSNKFSLNYSVTFQDNINKNIRYTDSSNSTAIRESGRSHNNQRIGLWASSLYSNNIFFVNSGFFYELPTTDGSKEDELQYAIGIQPNIAFYTSVAGLSYGLNASVEHYAYPDNQFIPEWCSFNCDDVGNQVRRQKLIVGLSPYVSYILNDKAAIKSSLVFDWDQDGDSNDFRANLDDIATLGADYKVLKNVTVGAGLEAAITRASLKKTAVVGSLNLSI